MYRYWYVRIVCWPMVGSTHGHAKEYSMTVYQRNHIIVQKAAQTNNDRQHWYECGAQHISNAARKILSPYLLLFDPSDRSKNGDLYIFAG